MIGASEARQNEGSCGRKARAILPAFVRSEILLIRSINKGMGVKPWSHISILALMVLTLGSFCSKV